VLLFDGNLQVIFLNNLEMARAVCKAINVSDTEELAKHLLRVMEASRLSVPLLEVMIKDEISDTREIASRTLQTKKQAKSQYHFIFSSSS